MRQTIFPWPQGKPFLATCVRRFMLLGGDHEVPSEGCSCGVYAWRDLPRKAAAHHLVGARTRGDEAWGVVQLLGKVVVHARGYRAEKARPVAVVGNDEVARRYGVLTLGSLTDWEG
jgi:hypothetical protein